MICLASFCSSFNESLNFISPLGFLFSLKDSSL